MGMDLQIDPQIVIDTLFSRINSLELENIALRSAVDSLTKENDALMIEADACQRESHRLERLLGQQAV